MRRDIDETLDDLLCRWHHWQQEYQPVRAYSGRALVCGDYRSGRQYDVENGVLDDALELQTMRAVDFAVDQLSPLFRIAIHQDARNLVVGCAVFVSPRLPADREQRQQIVADARQALSVRLLHAGVM